MHVYFREKTHKLTFLQCKNSTKSVNSNIFFISPSLQAIYLQLQNYAKLHVSNPSKKLFSHKLSIPISIYIMKVPLQYGCISLHLPLARHCLSFGPTIEKPSLHVKVTLLGNTVREPLMSPFIRGARRPQSTARQSQTISQHSFYVCLDVSQSYLPALV